MATIPIKFGSNGEQNSIELGCFIKFPSNPGNSTCIVDIKGALAGFFRLVLESNGVVLMQYAYLANEVTGSASGVNVLAPGQWAWIACAFGGGYPGGTNNMGCRGQVWQGGVTGGYHDYATNLSTDASQVLASDLGWGVPLGSTFDPWPNSSGWEMASLFIKDGGNYFNSVTLQNPPTSDLSPSGMKALYLCHQSLGTVASVTDSSGNGYDLVPGPRNAAIVGDGPY